MHCDNCNSKLAARVQYVLDSKTKQMFSGCDICSGVAPQWNPDVFLEPGSGERTNENLCNPKTGQPIPYSSKQEKAAIMRMLKVREAGDHEHGARNESHLHRKTYFT